MQREWLVGNLVAADKMRWESRTFANNTYYFVFRAYSYDAVVQARTYKIAEELSVRVIKTLPRGGAWKVMKDDTQAHALGTESENSEFLNRFVLELVGR
jgi:hypothetical protein